ncbi:response regulator [Mucilaginibacter terrae]|uniref:DNA-binding response OmpR family regulator n=1 Tax=Mucilaginibacter terrae TaxID=1955052 RepID=A0ABU3GNK8_9SPHI|nr:response regulator transcription factor [Mucilaginibacter terrae]MDT3401372.1 DNA-binding response OmpR family regulator [Mucilaginibacter terrae]
MPKIIICDDEQDILDITATILETEGFNVITVLNSLTAISTIALEKPDLVLIDLWMPGISGDQIVKQMRQNPAFVNLPVIVISASTDGREIALTAGANDFIEKPYDIDDLVNKVNKYLPMQVDVAS